MSNNNLDPYQTLKSILQVTSAYIGKDYLKVICDELKLLFDAQLVFITEAIDSNPTTKVKILYSTSNDFSGDFFLEGTPCKLVYNNKIIQITKAVNINFEQEKDTLFESFYGIPINNKEGLCIGHIAILSYKRREFSKEVEEIAQIFSRRIEIEYARILEEKEKEKTLNKLLEFSEIDSLTNLYNRRFFSQKCEEVFNQSKRNFNKSSIIFLDLDSFKTINDKHGHSTGDYVLKEVSKIFKSVCRKDIDFVSRIGGEEFVIISLNLDAQKAVLLAKRIMEETSKFFKNEEYKVTYSIGIEEFNPKYNSWEDVYNLADKKMYEAKSTGKNKIVS